MKQRSAISNRHINPPRDEYEFEVALIDVANHIFDSTNFSRIGKRGTAQHGGDLRGCWDDDPDKKVIIQAKCRELGKREKVKTLTDDAEAAAGYHKPVLFVFATTAHAQLSLEEEVERLNTKFKQEQKSCQVRLWDWNKLQDLADLHEEVFKALSPDDAASIELARSLKASKNGLHPAEAIARSGLSPERSKTTAIILETVEPDENRTPNSGLITLVTEKIPTAPDKAIEEFEQLEQKSNLKAVDRARIVGGIGSCSFVKGDINTACQRYNDAYGIMPERAETIANYLIALNEQGDLQELRRVAEEGVKLHPTNSIVGMRAAFFLDDESYLTPEVRATEDGWIARLELFRRHNSRVDLLKLCNKAWKKFPNSDRIKTFRADLLLEFVMEDQGANSLRALDGKHSKYLDEALTLYQELWDDRLKTSNVQNLNDLSLPINFMQGLRIAGQSGKAVDIGQVSWGRGLRDSNLALELSINHIRSRSSNDLSEFVQFLPDTPDGHSMRMQHALFKEDWETVQSIAEARISCGEVRLYPVMLELAQLNTKDETERRRLLLDLRDYPDDVAVRHWVMRSQMARKLNETGLAKIFLDFAYNALEEDPGPDDLMSVITEADVLGDRGKIIDAISDRIDYSRPSTELRILVGAAASELPIRRRSEKVFERLDEGLLEDTFYKQAAAISAFNCRNYGRARDLFSSLLEENPNLRNVINLYMSYQRMREQDRINELLSRADLGDLPHTPEDDLRFAYIMSREGRGVDSMSYAYRSVSSEEGQDSAQISGSFIAFVFHTPTLEGDENPEQVEVGPRRYVRIRRNDTGDFFEGIVDADQNLPWGRIMRSNDPRIRAAQGLKNGETFETKATDGTPIEWQIESVLPDYVRAARFLMVEHEDKFGAEAIIFRLIMKNDDIEPLLTKVRQDGESADEMAEMVGNLSLPLALVGGRGSVNALRMADSIRARGQVIRTNDGTQADQKHAADVIEAADNGFVIDLFTAVTAYNIGVLDAISETYGPIYLAENELDSLESYSEQLPKTGESGALSAIGGEIFTDMLDTDQTESRYDYFRKLISRLRELCIVEPVVYELSDDKIENQLFAMQAEVLAPIQLATKREVALITDDGALRGLALRLGVKSSVWLSVIISNLRGKEAINPEVEANSLASLLQLKHSHVSVTTLALSESLEQRHQNNQKERIAEILLDAVGSPDADIGSHVAVVVNAVQMAKVNGAPEESTNWALERFGEKLRVEKTGAILRKWLRTVLSKGGLEVFKSVAGPSWSNILNEFATYVPVKHDLLNSSSYFVLSKSLVTYS